MNREALYITYVGNHTTINIRAFAVKIAHNHELGSIILFLGVLNTKYNKNDIIYDLFGNKNEIAC